MTANKNSAEAAQFPDQESSGEYATSTVPTARNSHSGVRPLPGFGVIEKLRQVLVEPTITSIKLADNPEFKKQVFKIVLDSYLKPAARSVLDPDNVDYKSGFLNYIYQFYKPEYAFSISHHTLNLLKATAERDNWNTQIGIVNVFTGVKGLLAPDYVLLPPYGKPIFFQE
jgi:hypothetical protein